MGEEQQVQKSQIAQPEGVNVAVFTPSSDAPKEPDDTEFVLIDGEAVWQRDDMAAESGDLEAEHWWLLDGGSWKERPVTWETLWRKARVIISLEVTDIIYHSLAQRRVPS